MVTCDPNFNSNNLDTSSFCGFKKYIMKSYYEKYETLDDSDFQEFIDQEPSFGFCEALPDKLDLSPRLSALDRNLNGEGSHRHLSSSIRLNIQHKSTSELPPHKCEFILVERLPSGIYADPFELQHLLQRGGIVLSSSPIENQELLIFCYPLILGIVFLISLNGFPISLNGLIILMQCLVTSLCSEIQIWNHLHFYPIVQQLRFTWMLVPMPYLATRLR